MANSSTSGKGGAGFAARFLQEFAGEGPWAHLDIAGVADLDSDRGRRVRQGGNRLGRAAAGGAGGVALLSGYTIWTTSIACSGDGAGVRGGADRAAGGGARPGGPVSRSSWSRRRRSWGCWASPSPSRVGRRRAPTPWPTRSRSRSWPGWTARSRSRSRRTPRWAPRRSSCSGRTSSSGGGFPTWRPARRLAAFGLTEPGAGSDAARPAPPARLEDGEWVDRRLEDVHHERRHRDLGAGHDHRPHRARRDLEHRRRERDARLHAVGAAEEDGLALVGHARALLRGLPGAGGQPARPARRAASTSSSRSSTAAASASPRSGLGVAQGAFEMALAYAREREQFGRPDRASFQAVAVQAGRHGDRDRGGPAAWSTRPRG